MAVIAISQQIGSRGVALGELAAKELGYRFLSGEQLIGQTATRFNVSAEQMKWFDVHTPHFWDRQKSDGPRFAAFYRAVFLHEVAMDRVVVAGRNSAHFLPEKCNGLRVRVIAPLAARIAQTAADEKITLAAADKRVREFDNEVKARSISLFGLDLDEPTLYDVVLNTTRRPLPALAAALAALASRLDSDAASDAHPSTAMRDAAIAAEVHAALIAHPKIRDAQVAVDCSSGVVRVSGPGLVPPWDDLVIGVAQTIEGVASVEVGAEEAPITLTTS
jgi:cytidylate kinase